MILSKAKLLRLGLIGVSVLTLSGCGILPFGDVERTQNETEEYNKMVDGTLSNYAKSVVVGKKNKSALLNYVTRDRQWDLAESSNIELTALTPEQKDSFSSYNISYDDFLTSLGSDTAQQSIIITSKEYSMHVSVIWSPEGVNGVTRVVSKR